MDGVGQDVDVAVPVDRAGGLCGEILELRCARGKLVAADDERHAKALLRRHLQLVSDPLRLGEKLHRHAVGPQLRRDAEVIGEMGLVEVHEKHLGRCFFQIEPAEFLEARQQSVDAERRPDARQRLLCVESGEIVVAAAGADAAKRRQVVEKTLQHDPRVVVEPAGDRWIDHDPSLRHARLPHAVEKAPQRGHASPTRFRTADEPIKGGEHSQWIAGKLCHAEQLCSHVGRHTVGLQFRRHRLGGRLAKLIERPQHVGRAVGDAAFLQDAGEHAAVVDPDREAADADRGEQVVHDEHRLQVGHGARGADRVEVALHELAIPAPLRVFTPPHRRHVIPLEGRAEHPDVLGAEPGEGHGEVKPQAHVAAAMVLEAVELLVGLVAPLAGEDLEVFERRRVDRREAVGAVDAAGDVENLFAGQGLRRQVVAKALERTGFDEAAGFGHAVNLLYASTGRSAGFLLRIDLLRFFFFRPSPTSMPPGPSTASMYSSTCSAVSKYWS